VQLRPDEFAAIGGPRKYGGRQIGEGDFGAMRNVPRGVRREVAPVAEIALVTIVGAERRAARPRTIRRRP